MSLIFDNPQNVTTFLQQIQYINGLTDVGFGGVLGILILFILGGVLFLMMRSYGPERAIGVSTFVIGIIGILLRMLQLVNNYAVTVCVLLTVLGIYLIVKEAAPYEN